MGNAVLKLKDYLVDYFQAFTWRRAFSSSLAFHILLILGIILCAVFSTRRPFDQIINLNLLPPMQVVSIGSPSPATAPKEVKVEKSVLPVKEEVRKDDLYDVKPKKKQPAPVQKKKEEKKPSADELKKRLQQKLAAIDKESAAAQTQTAEAATGADGGVTTSQYFPYMWYLRGLQTKITKAWQEPSSFARLEARRSLVSFSIARDGTVSNIRVAGSSGMEQLDQSALEAVQTAQPFSPLPDDYKQPTLDVTIQFELTQ